MTDYFDLIDDYMDDALSSEDKSSFEGAMAADIKLAHAVENYALIKKLSSSLIEDETREQIERLKNGTKVEKKETKVIPFWKFVAAASVVFLVVSIYFLNNNLGNISKDQIIENLYQKPINQDTRGEKEEMNRLDSAIHIFENHEYDKAQVILSSKMQNDSIAKIADFYMANIYFEKKDYLQSEKLFKTLTQHNRFGLIAQFNLMTIYFITDQKDKGRILYKDLLQQNILSESQKAFIERVLKE